MALQARWPKAMSPIPYAATKAGIQILTQDHAAQAGPFGIRVNCIAPGIILSSKISTWGQKGISHHEPVLKSIPLGRMGQPEDVKRALEFLCTDLSAYVTGQVIRVDGGRSLF